MVRKFVLASIGSLLSVLMMASCASKQKGTDADASAVAGADAAPLIADKEMSFSPQGSDSGTIPGLGTVYFELDQSRLTNEARAQLAANAEWIKNNPAVTVQIEGHTDERGSVEYNLSLGERRAKSVKTYLASLGVDGKRLTIISYGEEKPLEAGSGESAWAKNRRANFVPLAQ